MSKIVACNNEISGIYYSGFTISKVYACGGQLVYESSGGTRPTPSNPIARVSYNGEWIEIDDGDSDSVINTEDINAWLTQTEYENFVALTLYDNCKQVGYKAFSGCSLSVIQSFGSVEMIAPAAFDNCTNLERLYFPCTLKTIHVGAFSDCSSLTAATICAGSTVQIYDSAFDNCTSLVDFFMNDSVTYIGSNCFKNDSSLSAITIPSGVTEIGDYAFQNCSGLTKVVFAGDFMRTAPKIGSSTFSNTNNCPIVIPSLVNKSDWARVSGWSTYAARLKYPYEVT